MKIGIDGRFLGTAGGFGRYTEELLKNLEKIDQSNDYLIFLTRQNFDLYQPTNPKFKKVLANCRWYTLKEQLVMPWKIWRAQLDLMHFVSWNVPLLNPTPFIVTIHDLILLKYPSRRSSTLSPPLYWLKNLAYRFTIRQAINQARRIIAVSEFTKKDILEIFKTAPEKIEVIYEGIFDAAGSGVVLSRTACCGSCGRNCAQLLGRAADDKGFSKQTLAQGERAWCPPPPAGGADERARAGAQIVRWDNLIACLRVNPLSSDQASAACECADKGRRLAPTNKIKANDVEKDRPEPALNTLQKYGVTPPFFLYVGVAYPHKNLEFLIDAFRNFSKQQPGYQLVLVGETNYFYQRLKQNTPDQNIIFSGRLPDEELGALYSQASLYLFPSLYEGFGLPALEAMTQGLPVLAANNSCLPEILGQAALYFDPGNQTELVELIKRVLADTALQNQLRAAGLEQIKKYSWTNLAQKTLQVYNN